MNLQRQIKSVGLTLVELVIAMSVMAAIGGIAIRSLLLVMRQEKIMEESASAADGAQWIDILLRSCIDNMVSSPIGDIQPFAENVEAEGTVNYKFLIHVPENYKVQNKSEKAKMIRALLVTLSGTPDSDEGTSLNLSYSTQPIGASGPIDDPDAQVIARNLTQFTIQSQDGDSGSEESNLPKSFNVQFAFMLSDGNPFSWNHNYPVKVCPPKETDKEESE